VVRSRSPSEDERVFEAVDVTSYSSKQEMGPRKIMAFTLLKYGLQICKLIRHN
jgi:hypothetical protein